MPIWCVLFSFAVSSGCKRVVRIYCWIYGECMGRAVRMLHLGIQTGNKWNKYNETTYRVVPVALK